MQNLFDQDGALVLQERECQSGYLGLLSCWDVFADFKQRWTFSQCVQEVLSSFHNYSINQNNFHTCKQQKASQFYRLVHNYEGSKIYTGRASSRTSQLYIPDTKKGIKYPSQQALEGLRPFGWKVSGLRPGSSCQDIRTGTLSNQVAWRILQTKAGSFLTVKVRTMIKVVKVLQM